MPRRDGTGPTGMGARTGRGMGVCDTNTAVGARVMGLGLGRRGGRGGGYGRAYVNEKDALMQEKSIYENRLSSINSQLNNMKDDE